MKKSSRLISNVRRLFGFFRGTVVLGAVILPLLIFVQRPDIAHTLGEVSFKSPARVAKNTADGTSRTVEIENLRGDLSLQLVTPAERNLHRTVCSVTFGVGLILAFFSFHWMWRLCRNVENGEIFSAGNLQLVRRLGWLVIAEAVASFAVQLWAARYVASYINANLSFRGLQVAPPNSTDFLSSSMGTTSADLAITQIIYGLLGLCLTEVFRQGIKLKQEADLTV